MKHPARVLLVFVDGLGLGPRDAAVNPLYGGASPRIVSLLEEHAVAADARLGVAGLPQSATGQTTLLTGVNAARAVGRHVEGFPGAALREIAAGKNIFRRLCDRGFVSTFANGYFVESVEEVLRTRLQSVTTVAALSVFGKVRNAADIRADRAVYQDLTRQSLRARGYDGPLMSPARAAEHLVALTLDHDLTLFEYFQTDRVGHRREAAATRDILSCLDEFVGVLADGAGPQGYLFVLTSDHGNVEDNRTSLHTLNPVPFVAMGAGDEALKRRVASLTDVTPALIEHISSAAESAAQAPGTDLSLPAAASENN